MKQILGVVVGLVILFIALTFLVRFKTELYPSIICLIIATLGFIHTGISWGKFMIHNV